MTDVAEEEKASTREERLVQFLVAMAEADKRLRLAIGAELAEQLPGLEQDQAGAAARLEKAYTAVQGPERDLAGIVAEIAAAEADRARWQAKLSGETPREERASARFQHAECESDITRLSQKRDFAETQLVPLRDAVTKARRDLEAATARLEGLRFNAAEPLLAYYAAGQKTSAYGMRFGLALESALQDKAHPEHDAAIEHMLHLCTVSGFRTEDFSDRLPSDARAAARFWDEVYQSANPPQPPPSGREVMDQVHAEMTVAMANKALERSPSRIDDFRGPAMPKPVPQRDYMEVPRLKDMLS